jgi:hypothetical protein
VSDVTHIPTAIESGDASASAELPPLVYDEPRKLAGLRRLVRWSLIADANQVR